VVVLLPIVAVDTNAPAFPLHVPLVSKVLYEALITPPASYPIADTHLFVTAVGAEIAVYFNL